LDPDATLGPARVMQVDALNLVSVAGGREAELCVCVDNSARWTPAERVWPVRAFDPYANEIDAGLAVALHALHNLRNDFFLLCDQVRRGSQAHEQPRRGG
jgi:hypothetical protein